MSLARTEEQAELAAVVRALLDRRSDSAAVRAAIDSAAGYDEALWSAFCSQVGVAALPVPEEYDGFGAGLVETGVVLEELGRNLAPSPLLATAIATAALLLFADEAGRAELLPRIAAGEIATVSLDGPDHALVLDASAATVVLRVREGLLELVEQPEVERVEALDQTIRLGLVTGGTARSLGTVPDPGPLHAIAQILTAAVQVGTAQRGLEMTVAYSLEREQFGRPIGSFQSLKHRMADMLVLVEASRSASWGATAAAAAYVQEPEAGRLDDLLRLAAVTRSYCTEALTQVASETVQLHGGIAITWEHDAQLVLKRAHALAQLWELAHLARARLLP